MKEKAVFYLLISVCCLTIHSQTMVRIEGCEDKVYPFELNQPELFFNWMEANPTFDSIDVFAMGEATHGTKEFFDIKAKTFIHLATRYHYKVFGIEASYGECCFMNDFLSEGDVGADSIIKYFSFWTWRTEEVKSLLAWIKTYNKQKSENEKIQFYGFDMQDPFYPLEYFNFRIKNNDWPGYEEFAEICKPVLTKSSKQITRIIYWEQNKQFLDSLKSVEESLEKWFDKNMAYLKLNFSSKTCEKLYLCLDNFSQSVLDFESNGKVRDSCMAENIMKISKLENQKMFVWAHNGHVNKANVGEYAAYNTPMGQYLSRNLGSKYYTIGFVFDKGQFAAIYDTRIKTKGFINRLMGKKSFDRKLKECSVPSYEKNTLTGAFAKTGIDALYIDLNSSVNPFFNIPSNAYIIGALFFNYESHSGEFIPRKQFDGMIYLSNTNSSVRSQ